MSTKSVYDFYTSRSLVHHESKCIEHKQALYKADIMNLIKTRRSLREDVTLNGFFVALRLLLTHEYIL